MALTDPQTITISGTAYPLARVSVQGSDTVYQSSDGYIKLTIKHSYTRTGVSRLVRLDHTKVVTDAITGLNRLSTRSTYTINKQDALGSFSVADAKADWDALDALTAATSGALKTKVLGGES